MGTIGVVPDLFFDLFMRRLREKRGVLAPVPVDDLSPLIKYDMWTRVDKVEPLDLSAVAVDGGIQVAGLSDGREFVVARAIAISSSGQAPIRDIDLDAVPPGSGAGMSMMARLEMAVAKRSLESPPDYVLMDGSLYVKVMSLLRVLAMDGGQSGPAEVRAAAGALAALIDFLEAGRDSRVTSLFVSKDSHLKIIKEYLLFRRLQELLAGHIDGADLGLLSKGAELYSIAWSRKWRHQLMELMKRSGEWGRDARLLLEKAIDQYLGDSLLLDSMARRAGVARGVSRPMLIGAVDIRLKEEGLMDVDSLARAMERRARDAGLRIDAASLVLGLPRIVMFHVKARETDLPLLVEVPIHEWRFLGNELPGKMFYEYDWRRDAGFLLSQYVNPLNYNRLLMLAHHYATFTARQFQEYLLVIRRDAGLGSSRRGVIGLGLPNGEVESEGSRRIE